MTRSARPERTTLDAADPRFVPVAEAFSEVPGFSLMESKSRAMRGLMLNGTSFGMSSHGRLILKLDEARVAELISEGLGKPFYPSPDRPMRGWIEITSPDADWVALSLEAYRIAAAQPASKRQRAAAAEVSD